MSKIATCLWFNGEAEEAATLYTSLFPNSHIDSVDRSPADTPSGPEGTAITVNFTLAGRSYIALNGGPDFKFTEAVSFSIDCDDQAEVDRYWDALTADGGAEVQCGWLKDKFGMSWQIVPKQLNEYLGDPDPERAQRVMQAMLQMVKIDIEGLRAARDGATV